MRIYDNQGQTFDRYTVVIEGHVYTMSRNPLSPGGVNLYWGKDHQTRLDPGTEVNLEELPTEVREAVFQRQNWGPKVEVPDEQP